MGHDTKTIYAKLQKNSEATLYDVRRLYSCLAHLTTPRYRVKVKYPVSSED